ncbi:MAG: SUF system Fe-S cluster assembly protein [Lentisphaeria bacterium]|nr:SUF system Fe-S cluster assembly protein [Candidatus Neomarinimicrobiota bacterium]MCF7842513.1 SUF system Fe-S cluster assembly protein [Lentisphaeria bacterium]
MTGTELHEKKSLEHAIVSAMKSVYDPEIPVNIYDLGLIYNIDIQEDNSVDVIMTLTAPNCPVAGSLPGEVERKVAEVEGVREARVQLVFEPMWSKEMMSEEALLALGLL